ncbi:hypothetical protein [Capillimicrobium parvum]|uniref:Phasin protein n=1 Tax=Capillimicrobium parvum TaxID=2884022 RepID=A0A9E6XUG4_9ACTN|nr:hypothetical protein [Capillimicrobium parvum]UGS33981.1 hypothetical protein DSM104329_00348 [Capillimicrobium parvum]
MTPGPFELWQRAADAVVGAHVDFWAAMVEAAISAPARAGAPGAAHAEVALRRMTDAHRDLWQGWLATATGARRSHGRRDAGDAGTAMLDALRDGARQLIDNQADWARRWNAAGPPPPGPYARP